MNVQDVARSLIRHLGAPAGAVTVSIEPTASDAWLLKVWLRDDVSNWSVPSTFDGFPIKVESMPAFDAERWH